ncbi:MAG: cation diffusion facilitator family transporter [Micromonosporaceae bacterium]
MAAGHDHGTRLGDPEAHSGSTGARHRRRLTAALVVLASFMLVEVLAAWWTGSLALLSDGAHMFTDVLGIGMALAAIQAAIIASRFARQPGGGSQRTFGLYRLEVLAALANAVLLFAVAGYVVIEAVRRFTDPPQVWSGPMLLVAIGGLAVNLAAFALLRPGAQESLNVRGAYLEVLGDTLGSVGAIAAAVIILTTGWRYADPIVAVAVAGFILPRTARLAAAAVRILVQAAPKHLDVAAIEAELLGVDGVTEVHDLHVWTLTSGMEVASAHLTVAPDASTPGVLAAARTALQDGYGIDHATLQLEPSGAPEACCQSVSW